MLKYVYTKNDLKNFTSLEVEPLSDNDNETSDLFLEEFIDVANNLVIAYKNFFGKKPCIKNIIALLESSDPGSLIKLEYASIKREGNKVLQQFAIEKTAEILELPDNGELLGILGDAWIILDRLDRKDPWFHSNLGKFWNGSRFYENDKAIEEHDSLYIANTTSHQENVFLVAISNLCEAMNVLQKIGLNLSPGELPPKLKVLVAYDKAKQATGRIRFFYYPNPRALRRSWELNTDLNEALITEEIPQGFQIEEKPMLVGVYRNHIDDALRRAEEFVQVLNSLHSSLAGVLGSPLSADDLVNLFESIDKERAIKELYIIKKEVAIPGANLKKDALIEMTAFPGFHEPLNLLRQIESFFKAPGDTGIRPENIHRFWDEDNETFRVSEEKRQEVEERFTYYTNGYWENVALLALRLLVDAITELQLLGYTIHYASLPFKLRSLIKLNRETGKIRVRPNIFDKQDTYLKIKGLGDPDYRSEGKEDSFGYMSII